MTRFLIDDETIPVDPMTVDYRARCVVRRQTYDVIVYGHTCLDYASQHPEGGGIVEARDVDDDFDHSAGRGRRSSPGTMITESTKHFFTPGIGRAEEIVLRRKLARL